MHYRIEHETVLEYPEDIREHHIELRLVPRNDEHQRLVSYQIETDPGSKLASYTDYYGNQVHYFCIIPPHKRLLTRLTAQVETRRENPFDFTHLAVSRQQNWLLEAISLSPGLHDFVLHKSSVTPAAIRLAKALPRAFPPFDAERPLMNNLIALLSWVPTVLRYQPGATGVHADLADALSKGAGVCQDFAHLFITVARSWGIPARYVMGYMDSCNGKKELATHAWAEALVPGGGWIGFDATHNHLVNDRYVAVAVGRDSYDAAPQRGSFKGESTGAGPSVKVKMQQ